MSICLQPASPERAWLWLGFLHLDCLALHPCLKCSSWRVLSSQALIACSRACWGSQPLEHGNGNAPTVWIWGHRQRKSGHHQEGGSPGRVGPKAWMERDSGPCSQPFKEDPASPPDHPLPAHPPLPAREHCAESTQLPYPSAQTFPGSLGPVGGPATGLLHTTSPCFTHPEPPPSLHVFHTLPHLG